MREVYLVNPVVFGDRVEPPDNEEPLDYGAPILVGTMLAASNEVETGIRHTEADGWLIIKLRPYMAPELISFTGIVPGKVAADGYDFARSVRQHMQGAVEWAVLQCDISVPSLQEV